MISKIVLCFFHAGHIRKRYSMLVFGQQLRAALAKRHGLVAAHLHLAHEKIQTPMRSNIGNQLSNSTMYQGDSSSGFAAILTFFSRSDFTNSGSLGAKVRNRSPFLYLP